MTFPRADEEIVTELLLRKGVRIERIVSTGQSTQQTNHIIRITMNGPCCSPARRVYGSRVKASVAFVRVTMS
jgi:hypothetical protein